MSVREAKREARRALHAGLSVVAYYLEDADATDLTPVAVRVRLHTRIAAQGAEGLPKVLAEKSDGIVRIVFLVGDVEPVRDSVFTFAEGEAYRVDIVHPSDDITATAEVVRLSAAEALGLPYPISDEEAQPGGGTPSTFWSREFLLAGAVPDDMTNSRRLVVATSDFLSSTDGGAGGNLTLVFDDAALDDLLGAKSDVGHAHSDYTTDAELAAALADYATTAALSSGLAGKSNVGHAHDDRYYTEAQVDGLLTGYATTSALSSGLAGKSDVGHGHSDYATDAEVAAALTGYATTSALSSGLAGKSDVGHAHDDLYYTEAQVNALLAGYATTSALSSGLAGKADAVHNHDGAYYTESEVDAFLAGLVSALEDKSDVGHAHGDLYYTEGEVDSILAGYSEVGHTHTGYVTDDEFTTALGFKSDVGHAHGDIYYTETEVDSLLTGYATTSALSSGLAGKSDVGHNHNGSYYTESEVDTLLASYATTAALSSGLSGKSNTGHTHASTDVSGLGALALKNTVATADFDDDAVTYAKLQNVSATDRILGRSSAGAGNVEEIVCKAAARSILDDDTPDDILNTLGGGQAHTGSLGLVRRQDPELIDVEVRPRATASDSHLKVFSGNDNDGNATVRFGYTVSDMDTLFGGAGVRNAYGIVDNAYFGLYDDADADDPANGSSSTLIHFAEDDSHPTYRVGGVDNPLAFTSEISNVVKSVAGSAAEVGNAATTETDVVSYSALANSMFANGNALSYRAYFRTAANGTAGKRFRAYFAGTAFYDSGSIGTNAGQVHFTASITRVSNTQVRYEYFAWSATGGLQSVGQGLISSLNLTTTAYTAKTTVYGTNANDALCDLTRIWFSNN